jgi:hypothetical protein
MPPKQGAVRELDCAHMSTPPTARVDGPPRHLHPSLNQQIIGQLFTVYRNQEANTDGTPHLRPVPGARRSDISPTATTLRKLRPTPSYPDPSPLQLSSSKSSLHSFRPTG